MFNSRPSLKLLALLALNLASTRVVDAFAPLPRIHRADGSFIDARALAYPVVAYNPISLKRQADSIGSWALLAPTCPQGTAECKDDYTEGKPCCPSSTTCYTNFARVNCCPSEADCSGAASTFPNCADPSWTLWMVSDKNYFCCYQGEVGYITIDGNGACGPSALKPTGDQVATLIVQGTGQDSLPTGSSDHDITSSNPDKNLSSNSSGSNSSSSSSSLSPAVITGIVVGAVIILILAGLGIYFSRQAGRKQGVTEAIAAFQQQQQLSSGNNYPSGSIVPGAAHSAAELQSQLYTQQPIPAEKYDQGSQFTTASPLTSSHGVDTNRYAEMDTNHLGRR